MGFDPLTLLDSVLPVYKEVLAELKAAGAHGVQFDGPTLVLDFESSKLAAFKKAYDFLGAGFDGGTLLETYFADIPAESYKTIIGLDSVKAIGVDLVRGTKTLGLIKQFGVGEKASYWSS